MGESQQPAAGVRQPQGTDEPIDRDEDELFESWLSRQPRPREPPSWPPRGAGDFGEERAPLGDHVADAWFR